MSKQAQGDSTQAAKQDIPEVNGDLPLAAQQALKEAHVRKRAEKLAKELNGPKGLEPTRYGDWEAKGRCYDF